jgi:type VI protein secretion system component Hcp
MLGSEFAAMLRCIRCGACLNHCPVYGAIGGHAYGSVYPGPMGAVLTPQLQGIDRARDLPNASSFCGRCEAVCPLDIPLPGLMRAWIDREPLSIVFRLWRPTTIGSEEQYYTITLEGALISGIHQETMNVLNPDLTRYPTMERVSFTYEKITESWNPLSDAVSDTWTAQCNRTGVISDLNFDGVVNILDFAILADQWLMQSY